MFCYNNTCYNVFAVNHFPKQRCIKYGFSIWNSELFKRNSDVINWNSKFSVSNSNLINWHLEIFQFKFRTYQLIFRYTIWNLEFKLTFRISIWYSDSRLIYTIYFHLKFWKYELKFRFSLKFWIWQTNFRLNQLKLENFHFKFRNSNLKFRKFYIQFGYFHLKFRTYLLYTIFEFQMEFRFEYQIINSEWKIKCPEF